MQAFDGGGHALVGRGQCDPDVPGTGRAAASAGMVGVAPPEESIVYMRNAGCGVP